MGSDGGIRRRWWLFRIYVLIDVVVAVKVAVVTRRRSRLVARFWRVSVDRAVGRTVCVMIADVVTVVVAVVIVRCVLLVAARRRWW